MTTEQCYNDYLQQLISIYERREAANISDWVFENVTGLKRLERSINRNEELEKNVLLKLKQYLSELLQHKPVQYVLNEAWFYKRKFYINEHVLIPRPETEELVEWIVEDVRSTIYNVRYEEFKILDIGTGSGCIAISIKKELENIEVNALDTSSEALMVANKNANTLHANINFLNVDFLDENLWNAMSVYDIIVSNPPYIPGNEKETMPTNVTAFEPAIALFVDDSNPFIFYEKIARFAGSHLKPNGKIFVEIHEEFAGEVTAIFSDYNFTTQTRKDIYGKERMLQAT